MNEQVTVNMFDEPILGEVDELAEEWQFLMNPFIESHSILDFSQFEYNLIVKLPFVL